MPAPPSQLRTQARTIDSDFAFFECGFFRNAFIQTQQFTTIPVLFSLALSDVSSFLRGHTPLLLAVKLHHRSRF